MKRRLRLLLLLGAVLAGCAGGPVPAGTQGAPTPSAEVPLLRLTPASLGRELALQQQLTVTTRGQAWRIDVLLEADTASVRLALVAMGRTAARLAWDGQRLTEDRAAWLPAAVSGERILNDLQLALWPAAAVRDALPAGWTLDTPPQGRALRQGPDTVVAVSYPTASRIEIDQRRDRYHLVIESQALP